MTQKYAATDRDLNYSLEVQKARYLEYSVVR